MQGRQLDEKQLFSMNYTKISEEISNLCHEIWIAFRINMSGWASEIFPFPLLNYAESLTTFLEQIPTRVTIFSINFCNTNTNLNKINADITSNYVLTLDLQPFDCIASIFSKCITHHFTAINSIWHKLVLEPLSSSYHCAFTIYFNSKSYIKMLILNVYFTLNFFIELYH